MCGIVGIFDPNGKIQDSDIEDLISSAQKLSHRGPDEMKFWHCPYFAVAHTKLAIFDATPNSDQPFVTEKLVLACNGEIYNYLALALELGLDSGVLKSDCEIILHAFEKWGIELLDHIEGDFAFVLYNRVEHTCYLARDHIGVKQLVYTCHRETILFSSESKALQNLRNFSLDISLTKISEDFLMGFWGDKKETYFEKVDHIEQGQFLRCEKKRGISLVKYFDPATIEPFQNCAKQLVEECNDKLYQAISVRMMGTSKIGTLLSGGVDSSLSTIMTTKFKDSIISYTTFYDTDRENPDFEYAKDVAKTTPIIHHKCVINSPKEYSVEALSQTSYHMEEVIWDRVYWPIFKNYKQAHQDGHKVILSGQGSDELWLGYFFTFPHYRLSGCQWDKDYLINDFSQTLNKHERFLRKDFLSSSLARDILARNIDRNLTPYNHNDKLNGIAHWAFRTHLQSNLMQEDRLSMASSVECRVPFVDISLVKLAYSYSSSCKLLDGREKYPIRKVASKWLPPHVANRNKFHFPESSHVYNQEILGAICKDKKRYISHEFLNRIFDKNSLSNILESPLQYPQDLVWKIVAICNFFDTFVYSSQYEN